MDAPVDLRSDTVSRPSAAMRHAMATADVGDDWYGDDPTVNRLQDLAAELTGKPAAAYLPTGTMCNQIALSIFARTGHSVICERTAHVGETEAASSAALSGISYHSVAAAQDGLLTADQIANALEPDLYNVEVVDLVALENTHQVGGGAVLPVEEVRAIGKICTEHDVPLYLDGARIFNACAVTGATVADYAAETHAMMFCLSKGLGAPIGSMLVGDNDFIAEVRRRKILFGGAWRQAGIMAAAGIIALQEGPGRLAEDHTNARSLAEGVAEILPGSIDPAKVPTNILFVDVAKYGHRMRTWVERLAANGLLVTTVGGKLRMLTHVNIGRQQISDALAAWRTVASELAADSE
ncbi:MAG TPA: threonine aldolase family protein [Pseudonocardiaceae bacterium]